MRFDLHPRMMLLLLACLAAAPATQPARDVDVVVTKIETGPTSLTAAVKEASPADLFFRLAQEAKVGIVPSDEGVWDDPSLQGALFTAEWENQPLWEAVAEACEATGLKASIDTPQSGLPRIRLERGPARAAAIVDGAVMIRPLRIVRSASVSHHDNQQEEDQVQLSLAVLLEPKLRNHASVGRVRLEAAQDENGKTLPPAQGGGSSNEPYGQPAVALLRYPPGAGKTLALVRGAIPLQVVKEVATVTFRDPFSQPREMSAKVGPHTLTLRPVTGDAQSGWRVSLQLRRGEKPGDPLRDAQWDATARPLGSFKGYVAMIGPAGETLMSGGSAGFGGEESHCELHFAPRGDAPTELRIELPAAFESMEAKFEFKDLPLP